MNAQSQILQNRQNYAVWPPLPPPFPPDHNPVFSHRPVTFNGPTETTSHPGRSNWRAKPDKRKEFRRADPLGAPLGPGYKSANQSDSQFQNRSKGRRFYPKKKFNSRFAPFAPRNTTSFLIRAKKSGGIASLVSPCPVTPATLPTPVFSPAREDLMDMAKEEWGVDGYGSMKGLIRLRSGSSKGDGEDADSDDGGGEASSDSDVEEERVEVERKLDHDLRRFEMIYPNSNVGVSDDQTSVLETRVDEQDTHISQLEEENLTLKEKLFLMERELSELRRRVECLETDGGVAPENVAETINDDAGHEGSEKSVGNGNGETEEDGVRD
ncbi:uncharacterized protein LOC114755007 [Neltuma alba]|uniref:uncharacterized protein LOC114728023 n=1 Tax=Neltuma alba TaxID=207710 RepID=UPI0010A2C999|nr:uncharacterized protein LOC114728023 [Prosopis alba]XP_028799711.1 uncharacterized protein LOC114755007 [Prosopis alba]